METGSSVIMEDSLFQNRNGFNYLNFWTTMDIKPEHTYRLTTEDPDGRASSTTVTTPKDFPVPKLYIPPLDIPTVVVQEVETLIDVQWVLYVRIKAAGDIREDVYRTSYRDRIYGDSPPYFVDLPTLGDTRNFNLPDSAEVVKSYVLVASAGPDWREEIDSMDTVTYMLPEEVSNVENGIGYVVGIVSKIAERQ